MTILARLRMEFLVPMQLLSLILLLQGLRSVPGYPSEHDGMHPATGHCLS